MGGVVAVGVQGMFALGPAGRSPGLTSAKGVATRMRGPGRGGEVGLRVDYFEDPRPSNREHHSRTYLRDHKLEGPRGMSAGGFPDAAAKGQ